MVEAPASAYTVRLSRRFEEQVKAIFGTWERWDELSEALFRQLPTRPYEFPVVPGTDYRAVTLDTMPPQTVYFLIIEDDGVIEFDGLL